METSKKIKLGVVLGQNFAQIMFNVVKKVKKQAISLGFFHILLGEYLLKQIVVVLKPPEWKFMTIIARMSTFKACVCYFLSNFYFSPNDSPSKTEKYFLFHLKSSFHSWDIPIFVFPSFPLLLPVSHWLRGWSKKNLKVYDVINRLNKNLITQEEIRCDIETLSIDRVLNKEHFYGKIMQKMCTKSSDTFLILLYNLKQPLHAKKSFINKIFWKRIIKKH